MQPLSSYLDYRQYLRDYYVDQKQRNPRYSHRVFARKAGLASSGFFSEVMSGKRQLAPAAVLRFCKALKLNAQDQAYFENLVAFNQAKTIEERNHHFVKLELLKGSAAHIIGQDRYAFYRHWYHAALREFIACRPSRARTQDDFAALGQSLEPAISAAKAKASVELLLQLGFIVRRADGILAQAAPLISTGDLAHKGKPPSAVTSAKNGANPDAAAPSTLDVDNFQSAMLDLARRALDKQTRAQRDFSTLTLSLSEAGVAAARAEIAALRKRLMDLAAKDDKADRVRQFNFQSFPLSKV